MRKYLTLSILFLISAILLFGFAAFFSGAAEVFDGVRGGSALDVTVRGIPIWSLSLGCLVLGVAFGFVHLKRNKPAR